MAKKFANMLNEELVEIPNYTTDNYSLKEDGTFGTSKTYQHAVVPVKEGERYILKDGGSENTVKAKYALCTTNDCSSGGDIPFVEGYDTSFVPLEQSVLIDIPNGCNYLLFSTRGGSGSYNLTLSRVYGKEEKDNNTFVLNGAGDNLSYTKSFFNIKAGNTYRVWIKNPDVAMNDVTRTSDSSVRFAVYGYDGNGTQTNILYIGCDTITDPSNPTPLADYYDITIPDGIVKIMVRGRLASYSSLLCYLEDITALNTVLNDVSTETDKKLAELYAEKEVIDLEHVDNYDMRIGYIQSDTYNNNSNYRHLVFDMFGDDCMLKVTASSNTFTSIAFLKDISLPLSGVSVPYVDGTGLIQIPANETKYIIVPDGTVAVYVSLGTVETYVRKPQELIFYRNRDAKDAAGYVVDADYIMRRSAIMIQTSSNYRGKGIKVKKGDSFDLHYELDAHDTEYYIFIKNGLPTLTSACHISTPAVTKCKKNFVVEEDGWFIFAHLKTTTVMTFEISNYRRHDKVVADKNEEMLDKYLHTLNYEEVVFPTGQTFNLSLGEGGYYGSSDAYSTSVVDVRSVSFIKVIPAESRVARLAWVTSVGVPVQGGFPMYIPSAVGIIEIPIGTTKVLEVPNEANFLLVYIGTISGMPNKPAFLGLYSNQEHNNGVTGGLEVDFNSRRDRQVADMLAIGFTPRIIPVDDNGWEIPGSLQQINAQKKSEQLVNIKWTPKWNVPSRSGSNYTANTEVTTGIPYSSNNDDGSKTVGEEVSIHTFMTAVDNPYSLLYTECINNETKVPNKSTPNAPHQASYWGKIYTLSSNGFAYYGTVCCGLTSSVENSPLKWNNSVIRDYTRSNGIYIPVCAPGVVDFNLIKIGDVCDNKKHSFLIYGLHRDSNGEIDQVKFAESTVAHYKGGCRIVTKTKQEFAEHVNRAGDPFTVFRYVKLWANTDYESSEYVPLTARGETETAVTYNNAICTFAGDKCTFRVGDLIVVNYNLYGTQEHDWTKIQVYKDDVLLDEYTLAEAEQTLVDYLTDNEVTPNPFNPTIDEHNHALVLGTELTEGMYKACMVDANDNASDYTYWEILDNAVTAVKLGEDEYEITVGGTHLIQVIYVNLVNMYYLPTYEEQQERKFIVRPAALAKLFGKTDTGYNVSVKLAGVYGNVTTIPVILQDGDITPDVEPDDDETDDD